MAIRNSAAVDVALSPVADYAEEKNVEVEVEVEVEVKEDEDDKDG